MIDLTREIDIAKFLPPVSRDSDDIQEIMRIENIELQKLWEAMSDIFYNQFIASMTTYGLEQWEKIFDVIPKATDTFQDRRTRILQLIMGTRPYTLRSFQAILDNIYGEGNIKISVDNDKYEFWLDIADKLLYKALAIKNYAETIVPKNLIFISSNTKNINLNLYVGCAMTSYFYTEIPADTSFDIEIEDSAQCNTIGVVKQARVINIPADYTA